MTMPRIEDVFTEALAWPPEDRDQRLNDACGGDAKLRAEVESLLEAYAQAGPFMAEPSVEPAPTESLGEGPGTTVGRYRLLQLIGEGGFGAVFMAEQREPVKRTVALKIIKLGMDTKQVIARFEAERQALAMMDHPSIAKVLDAGATDSGRPYFVMELVRGEPITQFCDRENLSIPQRLELFGQVCQAVQHAHQKGIIHRDLKPSNILVGEIDGRPTPKIIDFGIAKATGGHDQLTDKTLFTDFRQFIGTPEYMSPEQAGMGAVDIDTRSDIYSLGVLLYELLTGGPPFDPRKLRSAAWEEMRRIIREDNPEHPSTRLSTRKDTHEVAAHRGAEPARLIGLVRGDLDWIVMKCLEKDRTRRYETANALAMDLGRHLVGEPVVAAPPSRVYRMRKFASRNRGPVAAGFAIALVLVIGIVGTSAGLIWALSEADRANRAATDLEQVVDFQESQLAGLDASTMGRALREDIIDRRRAALELAGHDEEETQRGLLELEQALDGVDFISAAKKSLTENIFEPALREIDERFGEQPLVQAQLLQSVASMLGGLDLSNRAIEPQQRALEIYRDELGDAHPDTLRSFRATGWLLMELSRYDESEAHLRRAVETARRELGVEHEFTLNALNTLGVLLESRGEDAESLKCWTEVVDVGRDLLGEEHWVVRAAIGNQAIAFAKLGREAEAEARFREVLEIKRRLFGDNHPSNLGTVQFLGTCLHRQGKLEEAERYLREALEGWKSTKGDEHWRTHWALHYLARLLRDRDKLDEAERLGAEAVRKGRQTWVNERPQGAARFLLGHARTLIALERFEQAEAELHKAEAMLQDTGVPIATPAYFKKHTRRLAEAFVDLYEARHAAEPVAGHDVKAAQWRARLRATEARIEPPADIDG